MNLWSHLARLVGRGVAALLDESGDVATQLAEAVGTLERGLAGVRAYAAGAVAAERRLAREIQRQRQQVERQRQRVLRAADDEEEAHRALVLLREHGELLHGLQVQHDAARQASASARIAVQAVAARLREARQIEAVLADRQRQAELRRPVTTIISGIEEATQVLARS